ncbi:hypothetical protein [Deinococcus sp.]|uniref:hypothetical protein n=1 Tax=Deinococcus sp. TaxID=47478 RepID=UPI0025BE1C40|nr:hypothetical protein [Deinococcus sp.]
MRALMWLLCILLVLLGVGVALLSVGAYAQLGSNAPLWLRSVGPIEGVIGAKIGTLGLPLFNRALLLSVLASALLGLATYLRPQR